MTYLSSLEIALVLPFALIQWLKRKIGGLETVWFWGPGSSLF